MSTDWRQLSRDLIAEIHEALRQIDSLDRIAVRIANADETPSNDEHDDRIAYDADDVDEILEDLAAGATHRIWLAELDDDREHAA
jgi:hypothetical protein